MVSSTLITIITNITLFSLFSTILEQSIFTRVMTPFIVALCGQFIGKRILKNNSFLIYILFNVIDFSVMKYLGKQFYNSSYMLSNDYHNILIISIISLVYLCISKESIKEFQMSCSAKQIFTTINNMAITYKYFNFFRYTVLTQLQSQKRIFNSAENFDQFSVFFYFFIDYVILNLNFTMRTIFKVLTSRTKKKAYLRVFIKFIVLYLIACIVFYLNFNSVFLGLVDKLSKTYFPETLRIVLYNALPSCGDLRFKLVLLTLSTCLA